ncbi:MAG: recombinase RecA [Eubacteriales bacterium]|nr:recombinase RecA [Eubacteriales bacterium]
MAKKAKDKTTKINDADGREAALEAALANIEKQFGQGAIMKMSDAGNMNIETISTGSIGLDLATGVGGVPRGRIIEIYGPESSGKTTLALHIVAEAQKTGGKAAFIDAEHALDPVYAKNLGVKIDDLLVSQPDTGEQALEICDMLASSGAIDVIVIDSVAALVPKAEIQGDMGDSHVGLQARLMSQALRKITGTVNRTKTCVVFINQLREKVGVLFGNPETTTGGRALKFYATMRFDVRRIESIKQGDRFLGNRTRVKIVKNKVAPPFKKAEFDIMYGKGISLSGDVLDCAVEAGLVQKAGSWFSYHGERIGQGRENVKEYLETHPDLLEELRSALLATLKPEDASDDAPETDAPSSKEPENLSRMDDTYEVDSDGVIIE